jgi:RES domain-containing protein
MPPDLSSVLPTVNIGAYVIEMPVDNYVSYRFAGDPFGSSGQEARYNQIGVPAYYLADREETARHEKRFKLDTSELYHVNPGIIRVFNATKFAQDNLLSPLLTGSADEGGYEFCQQLASHLTGTCGISGVCYPSRQMALGGNTGTCVVMLPQCSQLVDGKLCIFEKKT